MVMRVVRAKCNVKEKWKENIKYYGENKGSTSSIEAQMKRRIPGGWWDIGPTTPENEQNLNVSFDKDD